MTLVDEHIAKAEKNERLYERLLGTEFNDWALTGLFYAALHYVDAYFARESNDAPQSHRERNGRVRRDITLDEIRSYYFDLYALSIRARYELETISEYEVREAMVEHFIPLRAHIRALLGLP